jgi:hypothetical protein
MDGPFRGETMTRAEIEATYPGAVDAVMIQEAPEWESTWDLVRQIGLPPQEIIARLKRAANKTLIIAPIGPLRNAIGQMDHPNFLRYVGAKLGMM